jgi:hypothetical protein
MTHLDSYVKRNIECEYCRKPIHIAKYCYRRKNHESNQRYKRHNGNFVHKDILVNDGFKNLKLFISEVALSAENDDENAWFIDFGASDHMTCNKECYDEYYEKNDGTHIYLEDNISHKVQGYGVISVNLPNGQLRQMHDVMYVPSIKKNLIYVSTIIDNNLTVVFGKLKCVVKYIQDHYRIVSIGTRVSGLYKLDVTMNCHVALTSTTMSTEELWHHMYGHLNYNDLMLLQRKTMVEGLHVMKNDHFPCEACALGKQHREEFPIHTEKIQTNILELIHIDVCRPMQTRSLGGALYFLFFVYYRSRYTWVYFIRRKGDVFEYFKEFRTMTEKQTCK